MIIGEAPAGTQKADWGTLGWRAENTRYLVKNFQIATGLIMSLKPKDHLAIVACRYFVKRLPENFVADFRWLCGVLGEDIGGYCPVKRARIIRFDKNLAEVIGLNNNTLSVRKRRGLDQLGELLVEVA